MLTKYNTLFPGLQTFLQACQNQQTVIADERTPMLERLATFVAETLKAGLTPRITYICTHNSRRSHFGQFAAKAAAAYHRLELETYSGGTEVTAMNPNAVAALRRAGFQIEVATEGSNPRYAVFLSHGVLAGHGWSKTYADPANPQTGFAAVMTCTQADEACPWVEGASIRVALPYLDPKAADSTPQEAATYDLRLRQIAIEQVYVMQRASELING